MEDSFYSRALRKNAIPIVLGVLGLILVLIGLFSASSRSNHRSNLQFQAQSESKNQASASATQSKITVDIEGAVLMPGVYEIAPGSKVHDVIVASGGISAQADRKWFAKNLNQGATLTDGQKIYIPRVGEEISTAASTSVATSSAGDSTSNLIRLKVK